MFHCNKALQAVYLGAPARRAGERRIDPIAFLKSRNKTACVVSCHRIREGLAGLAILLEGRLGGSMARLTKILSVENCTCRASEGTNHKHVVMTLVSGGAALPVRPRDGVKEADVSAKSFEPIWTAKAMS